MLLLGCAPTEDESPHALRVGLPADPLFGEADNPNEGLNGFSRDLVEAFARQIGKEVEFTVAPDHPALMEMLRRGKVDIAATVPVGYDDSILGYSSTLVETPQVIVQHASALRVDAIRKLAAREIAVPRGAAQIVSLRELNIDPPPLLEELAETDEIELLADLARHRHDLVASDKLHFDIASNYFPELDIALTLPQQNRYAWAYVAANRELGEQIAGFLATANQEGVLRRLVDSYFGHIARRRQPDDIQAMLAHTRERLPHYRQHFQQAQRITGIDWRLIAALAYQESQWDPLATSPTGVRGMMMLTEDTADRLGVSNRLDPEESIRAGAKYLAMLIDELATDVKPPDRLWLALAAYNLGLGHLRGARYLAPGVGRDPNLWVDMKEVLPLMARPEYYKRLKSGRARGGEAVILVENIRGYYDILTRFEPPLAPFAASGKNKHRRHSGTAMAEGMSGMSGMGGLSGNSRMMGMGGATGLRPPKPAPQAERDKTSAPPK